MKLLSRTNPMMTMWLASSILLVLLAVVLLAALAAGSSGNGWQDLLRSLIAPESVDATRLSIIWQLRFPRALLAIVVGATLSLGGLVFQALLRNPLAEPYILGVSGGSAIGAILGILVGFSRYPGVWLCAFAGSMVTLGILLLIAGHHRLLSSNLLLLSGVMVNSFCSAVIMFLISMAQDSRLHNIIFWMMGDLSSTNLKQALLLAALAGPCWLYIFLRSHTMNLMAMGPETAQSMGVNIQATTISLLVCVSLMVSATVSHCGLVGFVGLVIPHVLRLLLGPDHRILVPATALGGGAFLVFCDTLARTLPRQGEIPAGVITALIGAPIFIMLLKRSR